ncbi:unnamed protein product, partial [Polarella glacialis]
AVPESWIPEEDADVLADIFRRARPRVLRRYAAAWPAAGRGLEELCRSSSQDETDAPALQVEVQVGAVGGTGFHGFGGVLD